MFIPPTVHEQVILAYYYSLMISVGLSASSKCDPDMTLLHNHQSGNSNNIQYSVNIVNIKEAQHCLADNLLL